MTDSRSTHEEIVADFVGGVAMRATALESTDLDALLPVVYDELRVLASYLLRGEREAATLQPTALAHEAYLRLARQERGAPRNAGHLLCLAATFMRRVLVDYARERQAQKRGGGIVRVSLSHGLDVGVAPRVDLLELDDALRELEAQDARKARVVEMLFLSGFTLPEAASALGVSVKTVQRDWDFARAWLYRNLAGDDGNAG